MLAWFPLQMNAQVEEVPETADSTSVVPEGYELVDSVIFVPASRVDSALVGRNIFDMMPSKSAGDAADVNIYQSPAIVSANGQVIRDERIQAVHRLQGKSFFDNRQSARQDSEEMVRTFEKMYPGGAGIQELCQSLFQNHCRGLQDKVRSHAFPERDSGGVSQVVHRQGEHRLSCHRQGFALH